MAGLVFLVASDFIRTRSGERVVRLNRIDNNRDSLHRVNRTQMAARAKCFEAIKVTSMAV